MKTLSLFHFGYKGMNDGRYDVNMQKDLLYFELIDLMKEVFALLKPFFFFSTFF